ncbi:hypothetical protein GCM10010407_19940 [Rarobacter incanus]
MDGFAGFKTAAAEELPTAVTVMNPFHVVRLAPEGLDECRRRVQQQTLFTGDTAVAVDDERVIRRVRNRHAIELQELLGSPGGGEPQLLDVGAGAK